MCGLFSFKPNQPYSRILANVIKINYYLYFKVFVLYFIECWFHLELQRNIKTYQCSSVCLPPSRTQVYTHILQNCSWSDRSENKIDHWTLYKDLILKLEKKWPLILTRISHWHASWIFLRQVATRAHIAWTHTGRQLSRYIKKIQKAASL